MQEQEGPATASDAPADTSPVRGRKMPRKGIRKPAKADAPDIAGGVNLCTPALAALGQCVQTCGCGQTPWRGG